MHDRLWHDAPPIGTADRDDFRWGDAVVRPATRRLDGPAGNVTLEPQVMRVLLALADAEGGVVTRDALNLRCWGGRVVGDDSLNRTIGALRRAARDTGSAAMAVETIPKTGYRLLGGSPLPNPLPETSSEVDFAAPARRALLIGGVAVLALGGVGLIDRRRGADADRVALAERAEAAMRQDTPADIARAAALLEQATRRAPDDARLWGRLAVARQMLADSAMPVNVASAVAACQAAAARALAIDARQPDALAARALLAPLFGDWLAAERRYRAVLAVDPAQVEAASGLAVLLMATGQTTANAVISNRLAIAAPMAPGRQFRRVYALWNQGRLADVDRVADRAMQLWPRHHGVWYARLWTLAFTGRAAAALAQVEDARADHGFLPSATLNMLGLGMVAMRSGAKGDVRAASDLAYATAGGGRNATIDAILILTGIGALDRAFAVINAYLSHGGPLTVRAGRDQPPVQDQWHRKTMMLFVAATARLRADARFMPLCVSIGLSDYWRAAGVTPDFLKR